MNFRIAYLTAALVAIISAPVHAAGCPGFMGKGVTVKGEVIEHMTGAGMLKIQTGECGKITVGIPATTKAELDAYYKACPKGTFALAEGDVLLSILQAKELDCL